MKIKKIVFFPTSGIGNALFQFIGIYSLYFDSSSKIYFSNLLQRKNFLTNLLNWKIHLYPNNICHLYNKKPTTILDLLALLNLFIISKMRIMDKQKFLYVNILDTKYIFGYFQNKQYLDWHSSRYLTMNMFKDLISLNSFSNDYLVVHIREGDFITSNMCLDLTYYDKSLYSLSCINIKVDKIFIVGIYTSSTLHRVKSLICKYFPNHYIVCENSSVISDFELIWKSNYVISSNSTFCFWSAFYGNSIKTLIPFQLSHQANVWPHKKSIQFIK